MMEKAERFNTDAYISDIALIGQIQEELGLSSRKEVVHILCDGYRGIKSDVLEKGKVTCEYLSADGSECFRNFPKTVKTNPKRCEGCKKIEELKIEHERQLQVLHKNSPSPKVTTSDIEHLNIDQKDGAIQIYLNKRTARLELRKERIVETYLKEQARQKAKTEGEAARAEIRKEIENEKRFAKRYIQTGKPKVDWTQAEGFDTFDLGDQ